MNNTMLETFVASLQRIAEEIRNLERDASCALYEKKDKAGYTGKLTAKTKLLARLPDLLSEMQGELPESLNSYAKDHLGGMAFSAEKALALSSIFYMSALLYPENYKDGDRNDLENFIEQFLSATKESQTPDP